MFCSNRFSIPVGTQIQNFIVVKDAIFLSHFIWSRKMISRSFMLSSVNLYMLIQCKKGIIWLKLPRYLKNTRWNIENFLSSNAFKVLLLTLIMYNSQVTFWSGRTFWDAVTSRTLNTATSWALLVYVCQSLTASQVYYSSIILQWLFLLIIGVTYVSASCTETCLSFSKSILLPVGNKLSFKS